MQERNRSNQANPAQRPRRDHEPPAAVAEWGWRYHHIGIPTDEPHAAERYLEEHKMHVRGFDTSPYGVEWMRFEPDSRVSEIIRTVPHIAFVVDDLEKALEGKTLIGEPTSPSEAVRVAMILHNGMPVELMEFIDGYYQGGLRAANRSITGNDPLHDIPR